MTTLTKVFIVLLAVFSIAFSMLVIQYTARTTNWKELAEQNRMWAEQEKEDRLLGDTQHKTVLAGRDNVIKELQMELDNLREKLRELTAEMTSVKDQLLTEAEKTASLNGQVTQLNALFQTADAERRQLLAQSEESRKQITALQQDNFKLAKLNEALEQTKLLYEQEIKLLKERNYSISEQMSKVGAKVAGGEEGGPAGSKVGAAASTETAPIMGHVTKVDGALASVSVGEAHGVKPGTEFYVYRGSQYLGRLTITKVSPDQAAGDLSQIQGTIRQGDKVTDKF